MTRKINKKYYQEFFRLIEAENFLGDYSKTKIILRLKTKNDLKT